MEKGKTSGNYSRPLLYFIFHFYFQDLEKKLKKTLGTPTTKPHVSRYFFYLKIWRFFNFSESLKSENPPLRSKENSTIWMRWWRVLQSSKNLKFFIKNRFLKYCLSWKKIWTPFLRGIFQWRFRKAQGRRQNCLFVERETFSKFRKSRQNFDWSRHRARASVLC